MTCVARATSMPWRHADGAKRIANSRVHSVGHNRARQPLKRNTSRAYRRSLTPDLSGSFRILAPPRRGSLARRLEGPSAELIGGSKADGLELGQSLGEATDSA